MGLPFNKGNCFGRELFILLPLPPATIITEDFSCVSNKTFGVLLFGVPVNAKQ